MEELKEDTVYLVNTFISLCLRSSRDTCRHPGKEHFDVILLETHRSDHSVEVDWSGVWAIGCEGLAVVQRENNEG